MRNLRLVGLSADGRQVVFVDDAGAEFATPADDRLRAALRGDRSRLGQLEIEMDSALRPRDIQARIRAGETPEAVALIAQAPVERIMPYCVPVLAERQHVASLAQRSHVRRKNVEGPARRLSDVVAERLRSRGVDTSTAQWDAWRRDDGRWSVQATYQSGERERTALFVFDAISRFAVADDDEARWLTGERQSTRKGPQPRAGTGKPDAKSRRLSSVPSDDDLLSLDADDEAADDDLTAVVRAVSDDADLEEPTASTSTVDESEDAEQVQQVDEDAADAKPKPAATEDEETATTEPATGRKRRSGRRPSVPSWDEIMFGKGKDD